jgi:hypothetical protein
VNAARRAEKGLLSPVSPFRAAEFFPDEQQPVHMQNLCNRPCMVLPPPQQEWRLSCTFAEDYIR